MPTDKEIQDISPYEANITKVHEIFAEGSNADRLGPVCEDLAKIQYHEASLAEIRQVQTGVFVASAAVTVGASVAVGAGTLGPVGAVAGAAIGGIAAPMVGGIMANTAGASLGRVFNDVSKDDIREGIRNDFDANETTCQSMIEENREKKREALAQEALANGEGGGPNPNQAGRIVVNQTISRPHF